MAYSKSNRFVCNHHCYNGDIEERDYPGDDCSEDDTSENEYVQWQRRRRRRMHRVASIINEKDHVNTPPLDVTELYRHTKGQHAAIMKVPTQPPGYRQFAVRKERNLETRISSGHSPVAKPPNEIYAPAYNCACYIDHHGQRIKKYPYSNKRETNIRESKKYYDEIIEEAEISDGNDPYEGEYLLYHSNPQLGSPCNSTIALRRFATISNGPILSTRLPKGTTVSRRVPIIAPPNFPRQYRRIPTVPTPRYYRKPAVPVGSNSVYKRPSKLCLPLVCQPDYGSFYHRKRRSNVVLPRLPRKHSIQDVMPEMYDTPYYTEEYAAFCPEALSKNRRHIKRNKAIMQQTQCGKVKSFKVNDDNENTTSDMDAILTRYESVLNEQRHLPPPKTKHCSSRQNLRRKSRLKLNSIIPEMLKPRVPESIKLKQEAAKKLELKQNGKDGKSEQSNEGNSRKNETLIRENNVVGLGLNGSVTTKELDKLLDDLMTNKIPPRNSEEIQKTFNQNKSVDDKPKINKIDKKEELNKFDSKKQKDIGDFQTFRKSLQKAQLIQNEDHASMSPAADTVKNNIPEMACEKGKSTNENGSIEAPQQELANVHLTNATNTTVGKIDQISYCEPSVDDTRVALELHRSKSYIINLIDRALSKELGTFTEEHQTKSSKSTKTREAISTTTYVRSGNQQNNTNNSNTNGVYGSNRNYPELMTPFYNPSSKTQREEERKGPPAVVFLNGSTDDTAYITHLRQLRWGHLQHIQHEIQRLEDLERFLDKCSSNNQFYEYLSSTSNTK